MGEFLSLKEMAALWNRDEDEIIGMVESCKLIACAWYDGYGFEVKAPYVVDDFHFYSNADTHWRGWVYVYGESIGLLRLGQNAIMDRLNPYEDLDSARLFFPEEDIEPLPSFYPAIEVEVDGRMVWKKTVFSFSRDSMIFKPKNIKLAEEHYPELKMDIDKSRLLKIFDRDHESLS